MLMRIFLNKYCNFQAKTDDCKGDMPFKATSCRITYLCRKDMLENIIALIDSNGNTVVQYNYDAWGNHKVVDANGNEITSSTHIGNLNPFRYRGYYYDVETGLYFLQTRYYDPVVGRFLNRDSVNYADPQTINGLNLYTYCGNNPVKYSFVPLNINRKGDTFSSNINSLVSANSLATGKAGSADFRLNHILLVHNNISLVPSRLFTGIVGNISYTITRQNNDVNGIIYTFTNVGNDNTSNGIGLNLGDWLDVSVYTSTSLGVGVGLQVTPWLTSGAEISLTEGISLSAGVINGDTTHELSINIGWGTIAGYSIAAGLASLPMPGGRIIGGLTALLTFILSF